MHASTHNDEEAAVSARTIVLIAFDGVEVIDVAGPASVFSKAEELRPGSYGLHLASPDGGTVTTNSGVSFAATKPLDELPTAIDTLIVAGGDEPAVRAVIAQGHIGRCARRCGRRSACNVNVFTYTMARYGHRPG